MTRANPNARKMAQPQKDAFLEAYAALGNLSAAANMSAVPRRQHYNWMTNDPAYAERFAEAQEKAIDMLETEARRRGVMGTEEPVYYLGDVVGHVRKYSDVLLIFLLKGARPAIYRERIDLTLDVQRTAERLAGQMGLETGVLLAEAERILAETR